MSAAKIDGLIVARVQAGERSAFDLLVHKYQHKVSNLVSRYVFDQSDIEDITQEAFIKAFRAIDNFRGDSAFYTWLYRIAINTAKNYLVAQSRRPPNSDIAANDAEVLDSGRRLREIATPESNMMRSELEEKVIAAVNKLPDDLRTAITLREIEGLTYEEIAKVMECPIGTVRSRIFRARDAIDKEIRPLVNQPTSQLS